MNQKMFQSLITQVYLSDFLLLKYATSGDITGDYEAVVGYASVIVEK